MPSRTKTKVRGGIKIGARVRHDRFAGGTTGHYFWKTGQAYDQQNHPLTGSCPVSGFHFNLPFRSRGKESYRHRHRD